MVDKLSFVGKKEGTPKEEQPEEKQEQVEETKKPDPFEEMGKQVEQEIELPF